eukprot:INCI5031.1.p1 GENE.INCI5031.1~~INCI5031.1.p1  ORF type:complete len:363 (+),score=81.23 INCI5031.1:281-1369(+)
MDVLSALMLMAFGLLLLWILVIRKRLAASPDDERLSLAVDTSTEKASSDPHDGGVMYTYSAAWTTGRRRYMEDRYIACPVHLHVAARSSSNNGKHRNGRNTQEKFASLYGVFDGHGGARAADFCRDNMRSLFEEAAMEVGEEYRRSGCIGDGDDDGDVDDSSDARVAAVALRRAMETLDTEFMKRAKAENLADGTTAVVALTHGDQVVVGNIGDSRAVLVTTEDDVVALSDDHKPDRADERIRIEDAKGFVVMKGVFRVMGILAVSRAIGDRHLKPWVPGLPEMREERSLRRARARYLVIATDGLWDVMQNDEIPRAVGLVKHHADGQLDTVEMARVLTSLACQRGSMDNVTVVVVDLTSRK